MIVYLLNNLLEFSLQSL